ncbi:MULTISPECIES: hypothetical protein [Caballeronia]|uniref:Uncharacterized protein n=1 Tax=Caballeronia cordobensis TaxID=1353886 RepID=A0A158JJV4_CABCO|nr:MULTISPECIES: hypothetical protein [Caballeronia]BAO85583.1 hypothetical protein BRPE67_ACDS05280 [Burkholderia sp. RPE67]BBP95417.1 hypothetical protein BSFA1_05460 [Burkholderia sp. SFA1]SAL69162.1 hypothetical protein AWB70_06882 [Caballeronia cordobensis]
MEANWLEKRHAIRRAAAMRTREPCNVILTMLARAGAPEAAIGML